MSFKGDLRRYFGCHAHESAPMLAMLAARLLARSPVLLRACGDLAFADWHWAARELTRGDRRDLGLTPRSAGGQKFARCVPEVHAAYRETWLGGVESFVPLASGLRALTGGLRARAASHERTVAGGGAAA